MQHFAWMPYVVVPVFIVALSTLLEPLVFVTSLVRNQLKYHLDACIIKQVKVKPLH